MVSLMFGQMGGLIERKLNAVKDEVHSMANSLKQRANLNEAVSKDEIENLAERLRHLEGEINSIFVASQRAHEILKQEFKLI